VATGIQFVPPTREALADAIERAFTLYRQPQVWQTMQRRAMGHEVGWTAAAREYKSLYGTLLGRTSKSAAEFTSRIPG
jgi:starch synthase